MQKKMSKKLSEITNNYADDMTRFTHFMAKAFREYD